MQEFLQNLGVNIQFPFALTAAALIWARILSVISVIPFLFGKPTPRMVRVGGSVLLTLFLYPLLVSGNEAALQSVSTLELFVLFFKEVLFGLTLGFAASLIFHGFEAAGQMIDGQRGVSLARILIPQLGEQASLSGGFLFQLAIVLFLVLGGHRMFLKGLVESFTLLPLFEFPKSLGDVYSVVDLLAILTGQIFFIAVQIAAPVIIAILLADIILGVANRFAPQINVWELGFNIRGYLGILMLFLSIGFVGDQIEKYTLQSNQNLFTLIESFKEKPEPPPLEEENAEEELPEEHPLVPYPQE